MEKRQRGRVRGAEGKELIFYSPLSPSTPYSRLPTLAVLKIFRISKILAAFAVSSF